MSSLSPRLQDTGPAEADPDARAGPDGQPAPVEPAGTEGHDLRRGRPESGPRGTAEGGEELTPEELQPLLEAERASAEPADQSILEVTAARWTAMGRTPTASRWPGGDYRQSRAAIGRTGADRGATPLRPSKPEAKTADPSTKSISALISTIIWTPATRARRRKTRKAFLRNLPSSPVTLARSSAFATGAGGTERRGPGRRRGNHRQPGRERLPDGDAGGNREPRGHDPAEWRKPCAWCIRWTRREWARRTARMPAAATGKPQRQGRRSVADCSRPFEAGGDCGSSRSSPRCCAGRWNIFRSLWT